MLPSFHGHVRSARNKPWADVTLFFFPISCVSKWGATLDTKKLLQLDVGPFKDGVLEVLSLKKPSTN